MKNPKLLLLLICAGALAPASNALEITVEGYTNGAFNAVSAPNTSATQTSSLSGLIYVNSTFENTTVDGFLGIGGNPIAPPVQNLNNLGVFSLAPSLAAYTGSTFMLRTTFTDPAGINGGNTTQFTSTLTGSVSSVGNGGVRVDFNNTPVLFTFTNPSSTGSFFFSVNDLAIDPGQVASITGQITGGQMSTPSGGPGAGVPDSGTTIALLGLGLCGLASLRRFTVK